MKAAVILLLAAAASLASDPPWQKRNGSFATLETPAAMAKDVHHIAIDSIQEVYRCPDISLAFESETGSIPACLQQQFEQAVSVWSARRKQNWTVVTPVKDNKGIDIACIYSEYSPKEYPERPYYLYFGLSSADVGFYIHVRYRSLANLDAVERILKSIKLKELPPPPASPGTPPP